MGPVETLGYYLITFTAGHDTTKNSIASGMLALIENPDAIDELRRNPGLVPRAVEEIVRWTTPVNYMKRTAARDVEVRDQKIREGESLVLFYASANRDEDVFDDAFSFRVDRHPNRHLGFGSANTSAWVPTWRSARSTRCSASSLHGSSGSSWLASPSTSTRASWSA